jgi:hypothetical protein
MPRVQPLPQGVAHGWRYVSTFGLPEVKLPLPNIQPGSDRNRYRGPHVCSGTLYHSYLEITLLPLYRFHLSTAIERYQRVTRRPQRKRPEETPVRRRASRHATGTVIAAQCHRACDYLDRTPIRDKVSAACMAAAVLPIMTAPPDIPALIFSAMLNTIIVARLEGLHV